MEYCSTGTDVSGRMGALCSDLKLALGLAKTVNIRSVSMDFNYGTGFGVVSAPAYERLIGDAMRGDATLFTRWDAVETAWNVVMPVLDRWTETIDETFPNYSAGSQGPPSAERLLIADGREWRKI